MCLPQVRYVLQTGHAVPWEQISPKLFLSSFNLDGNSLNGVINFWAAISLQVFAWSIRIRLLHHVQTIIATTAQVWGMSKALSIFSIEFELQRESFTETGHGLVHVDVTAEGDHYTWSWHPVTCRVVIVCRSVSKNVPICYFPDACMHTCMHTYMFVIVNFDALEQAGDIRIERRQVVFLCWM